MKEIASNFLPDACETETTMDCNACVIKKVGLAQAFVPSQPYQAPSSPEQSLICGTAFSDLSMPYVQGSHIKRNAKEVTSWNAKLCSKNLWNWIFWQWIWVCI